MRHWILKLRCPKADIKTLASKKVKLEWIVRREMIVITDPYIFAYPVILYEPVSLFHFLDIFPNRLSLLALNSF